MKRPPTWLLLPVTLALAALTIGRFVTPHAPVSAPASVGRGQPAPFVQLPSVEGEARQTLDAWTYPGVHTNEMSGVLGFYSASRYFDVKAPAADVWRFYAQKAGDTSPGTNFPVGMAYGSIGKAGSATIHVEQAQPQSQTAFFYLTTPRSVVSAVVTVPKTTETSHVFLHVGTPAPAAAPGSTAGAPGKVASPMSGLMLNPNDVRAGHS